MILSPNKAADRTVSSLQYFTISRVPILPHILMRGDLLNNLYRGFHVATFTNKATLSYNGGSVDSNTVTGELLEVLSITKTAILD